MFFPRDLVKFRAGVTNALSSAIRAAVEGEDRADIILPHHDFVVNLHKSRL